MATPTSAQQVINAGTATQVAGTQLTVDELMGQLGLNTSGANEAQAYGNLQGQYTEANADISNQQLGLQGQGLAAQQGLLETQYGIQGQTLQGEETLAGQQNTLANQGYADQATNQALQYKNQVQGQAGAAAASGAINTEGNKQAVATNATENQLATNQLGRSEQGTADSYAYQQQQFGLEAQGQAAQENYSLGSIGRGEAGLGLTAQANGLSTDQTINQINYGMQQAGLQGQQANDNIYGQIGTAVSQGAGYTAGQIGYGALLGGVNMNQAFAGMGY